MSRGGSRSGSGSKPRYSALAQTAQQAQQRWRFTKKWEQHEGGGDKQDTPASKQKMALSPIQVPGSKLWLVPWFRQYLACWRRPRLFLEAFTGSGIVGLTMLDENRVDRLLLVEKDPDYAAVWQTALGPDAEWLIDQIRDLPPTREAFRRLLASPPTAQRERALHTLVKTWTYHRARLTKGHGFLANTSATGKGAALDRVWKPQVLVIWIRAIQGLRRRITIREGCGLEAMAEHAARRNVFCFADPPYCTAGQRMYIHGVVDISAVLQRCQQAQGPVVVSYEDHADVVRQAEALGLDCVRKRMHSATNTPMWERLISNRPLPPEPLMVTLRGAGPDRG